MLRSGRLPLTNLYDVGLSCMDHQTAERTFSRTGWRPIGERCLGLIRLRHLNKTLQIHMYFPYVPMSTPSFFLLHSIALYCTLPARSTNTCSKNNIPKLARTQLHDVARHGLQVIHAFRLNFQTSFVSQRPTVCIVHSIHEISRPRHRTRPRGGQSVSYILELEVYNQSLRDICTP